LRGATTKRTTSLEINFTDCQNASKAIADYRIIGFEEGTVKHMINDNDIDDMMTCRLCIKYHRSEFILP
jgi:hypothetical protein